MTATPLRIVVAINPQASFGKRRDVGPRVVQALQDAGHEISAVSELNLELLRREVTRAVERGTDALVVVGGDGMVSLGTNLVAGTDTPLGIVSTGTGNDMARTLELPIDDTDASIAVLLAAFERPPRALDAARVRHGALTTWFACVLSAGFDAVVNERANRMAWPHGKSRYTIAMLRELATIKPVQYDLVIDGVPSTTSAFLISVANGRSIGGGMRIVPEARVDDGYLDLFVVTPMRRLAFLQVFPKVFSGTHTELREVTITRVKKVSLAASGVVAYADGERIGPLPIEIEVVPGALRVFV